MTENLRTHYNQKNKKAIFSEISNDLKIASFRQFSIILHFATLQKCKVPCVCAICKVGKYGNNFAPISANLVSLWLRRDISKKINIVYRAIFNKTCTLPFCHSAIPPSCQIPY